MYKVHKVRSFPMTSVGGNPAPTVLDARKMSGEDMKSMAAYFGHECGFIMPPEEGSDADLRLRFFVPEHEMEMCGHATIAALWVLRKEGLSHRPTIKFDTMAGRVIGRVPEKGRVSVSQPTATMTEVGESCIPEILNVLNITSADLARSEIINSKTSRIKTMIALKDPKTLHALKPNFEKMETLCDLIGSTGLYPFAEGEMDGLFHSRQFPRASGFPEDAATGIAAAALSFALLRWNMVRKLDHVIIRQGEQMGSASEIHLDFQIEDGTLTGCWLSGECQIDGPVVTFQPSYS